MADRQFKAADLAQMRARQVELGEAIRVLADKDELSEKEETRFDSLLKDYESLKAQITLAVNETNAARSAIANDPKVTSSQGYDGPPQQWRQSDRRSVWESTDRASDQRIGAAMRGIEQCAEIAERISGARVDIAPSVRSTMERHPRAADAIVARSDPAYQSAFSKLLMFGDPGRAAMSMTDEERAAFARVELEHRAANEGTGSAGGYGVPIVLDPSILLLGNGAVNPFRALSKTVTGIGDVYKGVTSVGITANWTAEGAPVADGTPVLGQPSITAYKGAAFVPYSIEIEQDYPTFVDQITTLFLDARDVLETTAFSTGNGSAQPYGLQNRLVSNTFSQVTSTTHGTIGTVDVYATFAALQPRYRPNSVWLGSAVTANAIRAAGDDRLGMLAGAGYAAGSSLMPISADSVNMMLLGHKFYEFSGFADLPTNSTANVAYLTVVDLSRAFVIFDRLNSAQVELVPHLFDQATGRPTGQRGAWFSWRVGSDLANSSGAGATGAMTLLNKTS